MESEKEKHKFFIKWSKSVLSVGYNYLSDKHELTQL